MLLFSHIYPLFFFYLLISILRVSSFGIANIHRQRFRSPGNLFLTSFTRNKSFIIVINLKFHSKTPISWFHTFRLSSNLCSAMASSNKAVRFSANCSSLSQPSRRDFNECCISFARSGCLVKEKR